MENIERYYTPSYFDGKCNLCLEEKIHIILYPNSGNLLNQWCDLIKINLDYFQKIKWINN